MTALALGRVAVVPASARDAAVPLPAPRAFAAPVLIGDVATPLCGETVFSLLWKRLAADAE